MKNMITVRENREVEAIPLFRFRKIIKRKTVGRCQSSSRSHSHIFSRLLCSLIFLFSVIMYLVRFYSSLT